MGQRRESIRVRLKRTVRDTVIKLARVARAAVYRLQRERVSYAVGPLDESPRRGERPGPA